MSDPHGDNCTCTADGPTSFCPYHGDLANPSNSDLVGGAKRLSEAATPGPWKVDGSSSRDWGIRSLANETRHGDQPIIADMLGHYEDPDRQDDAQFIARARTLLPELAQQLEQAEQTIKRARNQLNGNIPREQVAEFLLAALTPDEGADPPEGEG